MVLAFTSFCQSSFVPTVAPKASTIAIVGFGSGVAIEENASDGPRPRTTTCLTLNAPDDDSAAIIMPFVTWDIDKTARRDVEEVWRDAGIHIVDLDESDILGAFQPGDDDGVSPGLSVVKHCGLTEIGWGEAQHQ